MKVTPRGVLPEECSAGKRCNRVRCHGNIVGLDFAVGSGGPVDGEVDRVGTGRTVRIGWTLGGAVDRSIVLEIPFPGRQSRTVEESVNFTVSGAVPKVTLVIKFATGATGAVVMVI